jgi:TrpR-related protein YerC/YecD
VNPKLKDENMDQLLRAFLLLQDEDECYRFLEDLCTINEMKSLSQRFQVARMLQKGRTYQQIEQETGASTATISRVKRYLNYGAGGYTVILARLNEQ